MSTHRPERLHTWVCLSMFLLQALAACAQPSFPGVNAHTRTVVSSPIHTLASSPALVTPTATFTPPTTRTKAAPASYTVHILLRGVGRPDDLVFDPQGRLLFSDEFNGTISRLNADGSVTPR